MGNTVSSKTEVENKRLSKKRSSDSQLYQSRRKKKYKQEKKELYISVPHDSAHPHVEIEKKFVTRFLIFQLENHSNIIHVSLTYIS